MGFPRGLGDHRTVGLCPAVFFEEEAAISSLKETGPLSRVIQPDGNHIRPLLVFGGAVLQGFRRLSQGGGVESPLPGRGINDAFRSVAWFDAEGLGDGVDQSLRRPLGVEQSLQAAAVEGQFPHETGKAAFIDQFSQGFEGGGHVRRLSAAGPHEGPVAGLGHQFGGGAFVDDGKMRRHPGFQGKAPEQRFTE